MAYIRKLASGWRAEVQKNGQRTSKVLTTKREAQAWAMEQEAKAGGFSKGWRTFAEAADKYEREVSSQKKGKDWEVRKLRHLCEHFAGKTLGELDAPDMAGWRDMRLKEVSGSTVVREGNLLKHLFHVARDEWRWLEHDPFRGVKQPKENAPRQAIWTWQQIRRVLRFAQTGGPKMREVGAAFHISLRTAMRLKECLAAPTSYDPTKRVVTLSDTKTGRRTIPIGRIAGRLLQRPPFQVEANEASVLFSKINRQLGIEGLTFHDARATALTLLSKKVDVMTLAKISGHRDISLLSNVYYRESIEQIARRL